MTASRILSFLFVNIIAVTCLAQIGFNDQFECLQSHNPQIRKGNWELKQYYRGNNKDFYSFQANISDTMYNLAFYVKVRELILCQSDYYIIEFIKQYSDDCYNYCLYMDTDTLYFYKSPRCDPSILEFSVGMYIYLFNNPRALMNLPKKQQDFFLEHTDSLIKTRGNGNLKLPMDIPE